MLKKCIAYFPSEKTNRITSNLTTTLHGLRLECLHCGCVQYEVDPILR